jgi:hypothetical protein
MLANHSIEMDTRFDEELVDQILNVEKKIVAD